MLLIGAMSTDDISEIPKLLTLVSHFYTKLNYSNVGIGFAYYLCRCRAAPEWPVPARRWQGLLAVTCPRSPKPCSYSRALHSWYLLCSYNRALHSLYLLCSYSRALHSLYLLYCRCRTLHSLYLLYGRALHSV